MNKYEDDDSVEMDSVISDEKEKEIVRNSVHSSSQKDNTTNLNICEYNLYDNTLGDLFKSQNAEDNKNGNSLHFSQIEGSGITDQIEEIQKATGMRKFYLLPDVYHFFIFKFIFV